MKKIILALVVLAIALPASAEVLITCEQPDVNVLEAVVSYDNGEAEPVRAFALEIMVDACGIDSISCLSEDYYIYPGTIDIQNGQVQNFGTCVVSIDANVAVVEMGSLYAAEDPCHTTAPPDEGDLLLVTVTGACNMCIKEESLRGGVVMESVGAVDVNAPCCEIEEPGCACLGDISDTAGTGPPDGFVDIGDLNALLMAMFAAYPAGDGTGRYLVPCQ
jgi:hypothetical protein